MSFNTVKKRYLLFLITLLFSSLIFLAGLWPLDFHPPNGAAWLNGEKGIVFHSRGIIYEPSELSSASILSLLKENSSMSIEIWLQVDSEPSRGIANIFCLHDGKLPEVLALAQWKSSLIIRNRLAQPDHNKTYKEIGSRNAIPTGKKRFLTLTSGKQGTTVYWDGRVKSHNRRYTLSLNRQGSSFCSMILGNDPTGTRPWTGKLFGFAIYNRVLTSEEALKNFLLWKQDNQTALSKQEGLIAFYAMNEQEGTWIRNHVGNHNQLLMPQRFQILKKQILYQPWKDFEISKSLYQDIAVNILGFIPFGFFALASFMSISSRYPCSRWISFCIILFGFLMSLSIELIQVYLPARHSSLADLMCNTLGTALGVVFFHIFDRYKILRI